MTSYSYEKGKYGGPCGTIFPYFREVSGALPTDTSYTDFIPAGFLRCRGQILSADSFPELAELVGVGATCIYRKSSTILQERSADGTGGTFQLPDLGSKYITSSANPGLYSNDTVADPNTQTQVPRAGIATILRSNGDSIEFNYTGDFRSPGVPSVGISGNWRAVSPPSNTPERTLTIENFVAHGHMSTYSIGGQINLNSRAILNASWTGWRFIFVPIPIPICTRAVSIVCNPDSNFGVTWVALDIAEGGVDRAHKHTLAPPTITVNPTSSIPAVNISASSLITTVNVRTRSIYKMDDIAPKFILCEYLIKY